MKITAAVIRVPIAYSGRYCSGRCCQYQSADYYGGPHCAAFGALDQTKGDIERGRWPRSIRHASCVKADKEPSR